MLNATTPCTGLLNFKILEVGLNLIENIQPENVLVKEITLNELLSKYQTQKI